MSTIFDELRMELLLSELSPPETLERLFYLLFLYCEDDEWLLVWETIVLLWLKFVVFKKEFYEENLVDFSISFGSS